MYITINLAECYGDYDTNAIAMRTQPFAASRDTNFRNGEGTNGRNHL